MTKRNGQKYTAIALIYNDNIISIWHNSLNLNKISVRENCTIQWNIILSFKLNAINKSIINHITVWLNGKKKGILTCELK